MSWHGWVHDLQPWQEERERATTKIQLWTLNEIYDVEQWTRKICRGRELNEKTKTKNDQQQRLNQFTGYSIKLIACNGRLTPTTDERVLHGQESPSRRKRKSTLFFCRSSWKVNENNRIIHSLFLHSLLFFPQSSLSCTRWRCSIANLVRTIRHEECC